MSVSPAGIVPVDPIDALIVFAGGLPGNFAHASALDTNARIQPIICSITRDGPRVPTSICTSYLEALLYNCGRALDSQTNPF